MFGEQREENIFSPKQSAEKRGESPSIPISVRGDHRECESFHSPRNSQMTDLILHTHSKRDRESAPKNEERERERGMVTEKGTWNEREETAERGRGQAEEGFDLL